MKIDMHCHIREGSIDSKVSIIEYAQKLQRFGIGGMVITDHDSFNGYKAWKSISSADKKKAGLDSFYVFKGVEYDTIDCGHMLIILPDRVKGRIFEFRGMPVVLTIWLVHQLGGIIGPAHPYYGTIMGIANNVKAINNEHIMKSFDFIEVYNACESTEHNEASKELANKYNLIGIAGSDAHRIDCVGKAYTEFRSDIKTTRGLIRAVKRKDKVGLYCDNYEMTVKNRHKAIYEMSRAGFWIWHKSISRIYSIGRVKRIKKNSGIDVDSRKVRSGRYGKV